MEENRKAAREKAEQERLAAIARETEATLRKEMGDKILKAYQQTGGQWIQNLGISTAPQPEPELPPFPPTPAPQLVFPGVVPPPPK